MINGLRQLLLAVTMLSALTAHADNLLQDLNGDGQVSFVSFGDSITLGDGDGIQPKQHVSQVPNGNSGTGYAARLGAWLGIPAMNGGRGGEYLTTGGLYRLPGVVSSSNADIVGFMEGTNDVFGHANLGGAEREYQRAINIIQALGKQPLLLTLPQTCCSRSHGRPGLSYLSNIVRALAAANQVPLADVERAWGTVCSGAGECDLMCIPEGLHPNALGYDLIAQTSAAALLGIDIFAPDGATKLEQALGWAPGAVIIKSGQTE